MRTLLLSTIQCFSLLLLVSACGNKRTELLHTNKDMRSAGPKVLTPPPVSPSSSYENDGSCAPTVSVEALTVQEGVKTTARAESSSHGSTPAPGRSDGSCVPTVSAEALTKQRRRLALSSLRLLQPLNQHDNTAHSTNTGHELPLSDFTNLNTDRGHNTSKGQQAEADQGHQEQKEEHYSDATSNADEGGRSRARDRHKGALADASQWGIDPIKPYDQEYGEIVRQLSRDMSETLDALQQLVSKADDAASKRGSQEEADQGPQQQDQEEGATSNADNAAPAEVQKGDDQVYEETNKWERYSSGATSNADEDELDTAASVEGEPQGKNDQLGNQVPPAINTSVQGDQQSDDDDGFSMLGILYEALQSPHPQE